MHLITVLGSGARSVSVGTAAGQCTSCQKVICLLPAGGDGAGCDGR